MRLTFIRSSGPGGQNVNELFLFFSSIFYII
ncbi:MAG: hypothetical protein KAR13_08135 [Desulfobulbaceae bacterium]|nr:hypothetical protein [Desulfobulbaceae bacterium]